MHFLRTALFASGVMAAALSRRDEARDCVLSNRRAMAADAECGDYPVLSLCFSQVESSEAPELADCYLKAGCSGPDAYRHAIRAAKRCTDLFGNYELKRRYHAFDERAPAPTAAASRPELATTTTTAFWEATGIFARSATTGDACFSTDSSVSTRQCDVETNTDNGEVNTQTCYNTIVSTSNCQPGMTCSRDRQGTAVCMDLENNLDVAGIIVTVIFGVAVVLGIATVTFLCCKDRKEQKRLAAKAEATALVRAATKKKRDAESRAQRAPLMQNQGGSGQERPRDASTGSTDPFHDRNRS